jgi:proline dehydrogenase
MWRAAIVRLTHRPWFRRLATQTPPGKAVANRFVAGETLAEGMAIARVLRDEGIVAMLDHLGEHVETPVQALAAREAYLRAAGAIADAGDLDAAIAVKLTQLGLDDSPEVCWANLAPTTMSMRPWRWPCAHASATNTPESRSRRTCCGPSATCSICPRDAGCAS